MNCLIVTAEVPHPPASGGSLRVWGMLQGLCAAGYRVTLAALQDAPVTDALRAVADVRTLPVRPSGWSQRMHQLLTSAQADIASRLFDRTAADALLALYREQPFDFVQFEGIETGCYLPVFRQAFPAARLVFDTFNAEAAMQQTIARIDADAPRRWPYALYSHLQSGRITRYEGELCRMADLVIAVSDEDAALLNAYRPRRPVAVVPSGIHASAYEPASTSRSRDRVVFTGKMDYRPNVDAVVWFSRDVLPQLPGVRFQIVGQQPARAVQGLAGPQVEVTGRVPSVLPYLRQAALYVAPLRMGSGTRLKMLEAMACGCAIVATPLAASGLTREAQHVVRIAGDAVAITHAIRDLLHDPAQRDDLGQRARRFVEQRYDWSVLIPRLLRAYEELGRE